MEQILKSLNNIKIPSPTPEDTPCLLKIFVELIAYSTINDPDIKNFTFLCLSKLCLGMDCYLASSFDNSENCINALFDLLETKFPKNNVVPRMSVYTVETMDLSKVLREKYFLFFFLLENQTIFSGFSLLFGIIIERYSQEVESNLDLIMKKFFIILDSLELQGGAGGVSAAIQE